MMKTGQTLTLIAGSLCVCATLLPTSYRTLADDEANPKDPPAAPREDEQPPTPESKRDGMFLPSAMNGLKMGMSAQEIQTVRKDAKDFFGNLNEEPKDVKDLCAFFGVENEPTTMTIKYYCKDKGLNSIYLSFEYRADSAKRDQELAKMKAALTKGLGTPNGSDSAGSWDKPGLFYSFSSGMAGSDGYWFAYQIDKKQE